MTLRMLTALTALVGVFVALYLTLYKIGSISTLACGTGGCEVVQMSRWATFLGLPVAAWGAGYYLVVFVLALAGIHDHRVDSRGIALAVLVLTSWGVLFSGWLTYLELFRIHAICRYCVVSAVLVVVLLTLSLLDWRRVNRTLAD